MPTGFKFVNSNYPQGVDFEDVFVPKDYWSSGGLWGFGLSGSTGAMGTDSGSTPQNLQVGTNWKQISASKSHFGGVKTDGTLWLRGHNYNGGLGDGTIDDKSSPVQTVAGGNNWKQVSCGTYVEVFLYGVTLAIKTDGTLWGWGANYKGELGDGTTSNRSSPVQISGGGNNWKQVSCGGQHSSAIKTDGTLWSWGWNYQGELGNNENGISALKSSPVQTVAGGTNWKSVSCSEYNVAAIKTDGTLWGWGNNAYDNLGISYDIAPSTSSPVQTVAGGTNWKSVCSAPYFSAAIKTDGTLWTWGYNYRGQLGDGTTVNKSSPVQTVAGGTNWKQVTIGFDFMLAIKSDGTAWGWGRNNYGQLGDGTDANKSSPVQVVGGGGNNWKQVSSNQYNTQGIREDYY
jgi:alpha-tubulin suppressor-like RCC1 family protein